MSYTKFELKRFAEIEAMLTSAAPPSHLSLTDQKALLKTLLSALLNSTPIPDHIKKEYKCYQDLNAKLKDGPPNIKILTRMAIYLTCLQKLGSYLGPELHGLLADDKREIHLGSLMDLDPTEFDAMVYIFKNFRRHTPIKLYINLEKLKQELLEDVGQKRWSIMNDIARYHPNIDIDIGTVSDTTLKEFASMFRISSATLQCLEGTFLEPQPSVDETKRSLKETLEKIYSITHLSFDKKLLEADAEETVKDYIKRNQKARMLIECFESLFENNNSDFEEVTTQDYNEIVELESGLLNAMDGEPYFKRLVNIRFEVLYRIIWPKTKDLFQVLPWCLNFNRVFVPFSYEQDKNIDGILAAAIGAITLPDGSKLSVRARVTLLKCFALQAVGNLDLTAFFNSYDPTLLKSASAATAAQPNRLDVFEVLKKSEAINEKFEKRFNDFNSTNLFPQDEELSLVLETISELKNECSIERWEEVVAGDSGLTPEDRKEIIELQRTLIKENSHHAKSYLKRLIEVRGKACESIWSKTKDFVQILPWCLDYEEGFFHPNVPGNKEIFFEAFCTTVGIESHKLEFKAAAKDSISPLLKYFVLYALNAKPTFDSSDFFVGLSDDPYKLPSKLTLSNLKRVSSKIDSCFEACIRQPSLENLSPQMGAEFKAIYSSIIEFLDREDERHRASIMDGCKPS